MSLAQGNFVHLTDATHYDEIGQVHLRGVSQERTCAPATKLVGDSLASQLDGKHSKFSRVLITLKKVQI